MSGSQKDSGYFGALNRRHLAACVRDAYSSAEAAPWLSPAQDALPPVPLLDSSDALDVVVAAPTRGPPASSVAGVSGPPPVHRGPVLFHVVVLLPLVLVCPSECSSVCSSFRSPCVRRPSALSPLFYVFICKVIGMVYCVY